MEVVVMCQLFNYLLSISIRLKGSVLHDLPVVYGHKYVICVDTWSCWTYINVEKAFTFRLRWNQYAKELCPIKMIKTPRLVCSIRSTGIGKGKGSSVELVVHRCICQTCNSPRQQRHRQVFLVVEGQKEH